MKRTILTVVAVLFALSVSADAKVLVYEPFAYADGWLTGQGGAFGTTGTWTTTDKKTSEGWRIHQEGNLSGVNLANSNGSIDPTGPSPFNGTVDNLWTLGGYVGLPSPENIGEAADYAGTTASNMDAHIGLDPSVTATFTSGTTTWFSFVSARGWDKNEESPQFMIGTDFTPLGAREIVYNTDDGGNAIGGGGAPPRANYWTVQPNYFSGGIAHTTPGGYLDGTLGGHDGVQDKQGSSSTTNGALDPGVQNMRWAEIDADGYYGAANIVVGKIEWDADTGGEDILSVVRFLETDTLSEAAFNALIAAQPALSSANWASNKPSLDQSQFDTLNFSGSKFFVDEIRIATSFGDAVPIPEPMTLALLGLGGLALLRRRRNG